MNRFVISGLSAAAALLAIAVAAPSAEAQQFYNGRQRDVVFVAPNGDILDYIPSGAAYARDRRGNRVLIDPYGNVIATEMRARGYYPRPPVRDAYNGDGYYGNDPYGDARYSERGAVTGSIPRDAAIDRQPLDDQPYPPGGDNYASIEQDQQTPEMLEPKPPQEPVITLKNKSKSKLLRCRFSLIALACLPAPSMAAWARTSPRQSMPTSRWPARRLTPTTPMPFSSSCG